MINNVRTVELINPPITVTANGRHNELDSLHPNARGAKPSTVERVVIKIGRRRSVAALITAFVFPIPLDLSQLVWSIKIMALFTTIPESINTPRKTD